MLLCRCRPPSPWVWPWMGMVGAGIRGWDNFIPRCYLLSTVIFSCIITYLVNPHVYTHNRWKKKKKDTNKLSTFNLHGTMVIVTVVVKAGSAVIHLLYDANAKWAVWKIPLEPPPCSPHPAHVLDHNLKQPWRTQMLASLLPIFTRISTFLHPHNMQHFPFSFTTPFFTLFLLLVHKYSSI